MHSIDPLYNTPSNTPTNNLPLMLSYVVCIYQDHAKALPLYLDVLAKRRAQLGDDYDLSPDNPNPDPGAAMLTTVTNLALCYDTMGEHDRAEPLYQESLEGRRQLLGEMHPSTLSSLHNAGETHDTPSYMTPLLALYSKSIALNITYPMTYPPI